MQIQQVNNANFRAKLIPGTSGGAKNKKLLDLFEQKTQAYKSYSLLQEKLNFNGKDTFYLLNKNNEKVLSMKYPHSCYSYCCLEEMADKFVEVFNHLVKGMPY